MRKIQVGLLGLGTVGMGVYKLLRKRAETMDKTIGAQLEIKKILVHNKNKKREGVDETLLTDDWKEIIEDDEIQIVIEVIGGIGPAKTMTNKWDEIVNDPEIDIVIELIGGIEPARSYILAAINAGKHVVTANKDLIAEEGKEIFDTAQAAGKDFLFEAAVAGGIPIIRPLKQCLAGNDLTDILGIVNGTTNYILTKMFEDGMEFSDALKKAQELGYAEADPTADVEGLDAGRKMAIMASIAFHSRVVFADVYTEGITKITAADIAYAKEFDSVIKLLGVARNTPEGIEVGVYPVMIARDHPLASVRDSFNAVFIHGDAVDDAMFYGRGAGEMPTASAVVGDVIDEARNIEYGCSGRISCTCYQQLAVKDFGDVKNKFFLRMQVENCPGVLAQIAKVFGEHKVSIARVVQKNAKTDRAELVIVTEKVKEKHMGSALCELKEMKSIFEVSSMIREY